MCELPEIFVGDKRPIILVQDFGYEMMHEQKNSQ